MLTHGEPIRHTLRVSMKDEDKKKNEDEDEDEDEDKDKDKDVDEDKDLGIHGPMNLGYSNLYN